MKNKPVKTNCSAHNGFVMIMVIACMSLIGTMLFVLIHGSNNLRLESKHLYFKACQRNLTASGLSWARHQLKIAGKNTALNTNLDTKSLGIAGSTLQISIDHVDANSNRAQIKTTYKRGEKSIQHKNSYSISAGIG